MTTEITRLGVSGFPRPKYSGFVAKADSESSRPDDYAGMVLNVGRLMTR